MKTQSLIRGFHQQWRARLRRAACGMAMLLCALVLVGCAGDGANENNALQAGSGVEIRAEGAMGNVIFVVPIDGAPTQIGLVLADTVAQAIRDEQHPALLSATPNQAGASIVGRIEKTEPHGEVLWLDLLWGVRAPYGTQVAQYRQRVIVDAGYWRRGAPEAINLVAADAVPEILNMVQTHVGPAPLHAMSPYKANQAPTSPIATADAPTPITESTEHSVQTAPEQVLVSTSKQPDPDAYADVPKGFSETPSTAPVEQVSADELPALGPASTAPKALTPGVDIAQETQPTDTDDDNKNSFGLSDLLPEMGVDERRVGDARPTDDAAFRTVRWGQPSFLIRPVAGAPGNGNEALTAGLKSALRARDITISDDPRQAGFVVAGNVTMQPPINGRQFTRIVWTVATMAGEEVGKAVQENTVVAGSLDGNWGQVAEIVSNAAVNGIKELFGDIEARPTADEQLPDFPEGDLPIDPRRAPPPPRSQ